MSYDPLDHTDSAVEQLLNRMVNDTLDSAIKAAFKLHSISRDKFYDAKTKAETDYRKGKSDGIWETLMLLRGIKDANK
jgi:hypothetical protein